MNEQQRLPSPIIRTIVLVAIPLIVAVAVAALVLSARDKESDDSAAVPTASSTTGDGADTTTTTDPKVAAFCRDTEPVKKQMQAASDRIQADGRDVPTPAELADLIDSLDISKISVDEAPAELRDDLQYVIDRRTEAVTQIRSAPPGTPISKLLPHDLLDRFATVVQYNLDHCNLS